MYAAALYPGLATIARRFGYALAVHGSLQRDLDLVAIPWAEDAGPPDELITGIKAEYAVMVIGEPAQKPHGRLAYTLAVGFGDCAVDLSFMPRRP